EPDLLETLEVVLTLAGYEVFTASRGADAIMQAEKNAFLVAITDLRMPGMSGIDTIAALRRLHPGIAVVVVSGYVSDESAQRCSEHGGFHVVAKPLDLDELLQVVERAFREARLRHSC